MTSSLPQDNLTARLFVLLSRWSLVTALLILASIGFYSAVGSAATDNALGQQYSGLMHAVRSPVLYRLAWVSESLYWLMVGGTLIIFAGLFARRASIRAAFIAASGIGQLTASLGAFSLSSVSDLAASYTNAASNQQAALLQSFLDLQRVIVPDYAVGSLLQCAGFLLSAWVAWRWIGFPRWLAVSLAIPALLGLSFFILVVVDAPSALWRPIVILDVIGLISAHVAVAVTFWRPSSTRVAGVASASAAT